MSFYQGGHSTYQANIAQNVTVTVLKCTFCEMEKPVDAFSKTQVMKVTYNRKNEKSYNNQKKHVSCKACTLGSNKSLRCMTCAKQMPLEQFAKSQRKHADRARCLKCMKKREEEDVWASESDSDDSGKWDDLL